MAARAIAFLVLAAVLTCDALLAQEVAGQFDDVAARAAAARDRGNLPEAIALYGQAEQLRPDWAEGWFYLGLLQYNANSYSQAIEAFNHFLALQPNAPPAMSLRGLCEFETAAYDAALRDLEEAVTKGAAKDPHNEPLIRYHYALVLAHAGRFQDALAQYEFLAKEGIQDADLMLGLGLAGMRVMTLPGEISADERAPYEAAGNAGYVFLSGDTQRADGVFEDVFARYPKMARVHFFYGTLLIAYDADLAIPQFQAEVNLVPGNAEAHAILAYSLMLAGRFKEARPEAEAALASAPEMEMAQIALGWSLAAAGDRQKATAMLAPVLKRDPDNLEAHMALAALDSHTGRREDAYRERETCLGLAKK